MGARRTYIRILFDPEKPTRLDTDTTVPTGDRRDDTELEDQQLIALLGQDEWDRLANIDDGSIPTVIIGSDKESDNVFLKFRNKADILDVINRLTLLIENDDPSLAIQVDGVVTEFRETWDEQER